MVIITNNPYSDKLQQAHRDNDKVKIEEYTFKSKEFIAGKLEELKGKQSEIKQEVETFKEERQDYKITNQYKESIKLYRMAQDLVIEMRELKKIIRDEIQLKRESKNKEA